MEDALPLFEKAAGSARTEPCFLNYGLALEAKVMGVDAAQRSLAPPPSWTPELDMAEVQYIAALRQSPT